VGSELDGCRGRREGHGSGLNATSHWEQADVQDYEIVPTALPKYLGGADRAGAQRAMQAMLGMAKLDIAGLKKTCEAA